MANTDPDVMRQKQIGGIDVYHAMGCKGAGYNVMHLEADYTDHGEGAVDDIYDIAPECKVYRTGSTILRNSITMLQTSCTYEGIIYDIEDFIREFNIKFVTESIGGKTVDPVYSEYWQNLIDKYNIILVSPAGNKGVNGVTTAFPDKVSIIIGAVGISDRGIINPKSYTGQGEEVDFAYFTGDQEGTSFSTPRALAVMTLLCSRFGNKTRNEIIEMLKVLAKDVDVSGVDVKTGWGVPILHADDDKLFSDGDEMITVTQIKINDKMLTVKRILKNGENYIRLRDFEDVLGVVDVEYDAVARIPVVID
jgi:hypothetical protein